MSIRQFTMEEVRCFAGKQTLEIRPLTFLVGENSTGKTTALACFQVLSNFLQGKGLDFNVPPYFMGNFRDIIRNSKNKEKSFKLGFASKYNNEDIETIIELIEKKTGIEQVVSSITMKLTDGEIIVRSEDSIDRELRLDSFDEEQHLYKIACNTDRLNEYSVYFFYPTFTRESKGEKALTDYFEKKIKKFGCSPWDVFRTISVFSSSPIRSQPKRTYDIVRDFDDPEGSDIPLYLMQIEATQKKEWEKLKQQLIEFGISSGLFQDIKIKNFGHSLGGPFQLQFKIRGPTSNMIDVGYGVSQIVPILVKILNHSISKRTQPWYEDGSYFLLQQPEVHLHPRAQAEFTSLLAELANQGDQSFIIETHSDYMIDRARIDIRKGNIKPDDVSLIYFEPKGNIVKVHNIGFDKMANMIGVPTHFRRFFLKESKRLMGFEE